VFLRGLEAIPKGAPLKIKIDASSSYAGKVFWPKLFVGTSLPSIAG
jgi:hypothetical protein